MKLITFLSVLLFVNMSYSQVLIGYSQEEIAEFYNKEPIELNTINHTVSFQLDSLESMLAEFRFEDGSCYEYKFILSCKECYDTYLFQLTESNYSDWFKYNDSIYYAKDGKLGGQKNKNGVMEYVVPRMILNFDSNTDQCLTAAISSELMEKEDYRNMLSYRPVEKRIKKKRLEGEWQIQRNTLYPTDITKIDIQGKWVEIAFLESESEVFEIDWISKNTCQFKYYSEEKLDLEIYLTCKVQDVSDSDLLVWFFNKRQKFIQQLVKK